MKKVETALGYEEIAQNSALGVRNKDRRMKSTEEELLKGRHHTLDLMEKAEDDSDGED